MRSRRPLSGTYRNAPRRLALALPAALLIALAGPHAAQATQIVDLGTFNPVAINGSLQIAGFAGDSGNGAGLWQNHVITPLRPLPGGTSSRTNVVSGINDAGRVAGATEVTESSGVRADHATYWDQPSTPHDVGFLAGNFRALATGINSSGDIVGTSQDSNTTHAFFAANGSSPVQVGASDASSPAETTAAYGVDDARRIFGFRQNYPHRQGDNGQSYIWSGPSAAGTATDLVPGGARHSMAVDGTIVGVHLDATGSPSYGAWLRDPATGSETGLGSFTPEAVNAHRVVVGEDAGSAKMWRSGVLTDLNTTLPAGSPWQLKTAVDVTATGDVIGSGVVNGQTHGYLLLAQPAFSVSDAAVSEPARAASAAALQVSLSAPSDHPVTVDYATRDGAQPDGATAGENDYTPTQGSLTFAPGETVKTVSVPVNHVGKAEGNETFTVELSGESGAEVSKRVGTVAITSKHTLSGSVRDKNDKPVVGEVLHVTGPEDTTVTTDASGRYSASLRPGAYSVTPEPDDGTYQPQASADCIVIGRSCSVDVTHDATANFGFGLRVEKVLPRERDLATGGMVDVPSTGTTDGNQLDVIETVANPSGSPQTTDVKFSTRIGARDVSHTQHVSVPAGSSVDVHEPLDSSGLAWHDFTHEPDPTHDLKVSLSNGGDSGSAVLTVKPKPVILVHGLYSDAAGSWGDYVGGGFLGQHNPRWRGFAVGDGQATGLMDTNPLNPGAGSILQNAGQEAKDIQGVRTKLNAAHVDIVAHSMGGLISRNYIQDLMPNDSGDGKPVVSHFVMLGTPNLGSACANPLTALLSPTGVALPAYELTPIAASDFNARITNRRGVPFSIFIGDSVPDTCDEGHFGDGVVSVPSARWKISDNRTGLELHTSLTNSAFVFNAWVVPHLALGPDNLARTATAVARPASTHGASAGIFARAAAVSRRPTPRLCVSTAPGPQIIGSQLLSIRRGHSRSVVFNVTSGSKLTITAFSGPGVSSRLTDPRHHARSTISGASPAGRLLFRTVVIRKPRRGKWRLTLDTSNAGSVPVAVAAALTGSDLRLGLSANQNRRGATINARLTSHNRGLPRARITVVLRAATGGSTTRLTLHAIPRHPGRYTATLRNGRITNPTA